MTLPTLTQRGDGMLLLARHFLDEAARRCRKPFRGLAPETESLLRSYAWRVWAMATGSRRSTCRPKSPRWTCSKICRCPASGVLVLCNGNRLLAAKYLGIARQTLARRLNEADARHEEPG